jgi:hypothetical protein
MTTKGNRRVVVILIEQARVLGSSVVLRNLDHLSRGSRMVLVSLVILTRLKALGFLVLGNEIAKGCTEEDSGYLIWHNGSNPSCKIQLHLQTWMGHFGVLFSISIYGRLEVHSASADVLFW